MRKQPFFRLLDPLGAVLARQLAHPSGWFGRAVMTRLLAAAAGLAIVALAELHGGDTEGDFVLVADRPGG